MLGAEGRYGMMRIAGVAETEQSKQTSLLLAGISTNQASSSQANSAGTNGKHIGWGTARTHPPAQGMAVYD